MIAKVTSPALIAAEAAANNQNTPGSRPCNLEGTDSRGSGVDVSFGPLSSSLTTGLLMLRQIRNSRNMATAPETISTAMAGQITPAAAVTAATSSGPATAPS
jgi:hypothetical protein